MAINLMVDGNMTTSGKADDQFVSFASELAGRFAETASQHDRENTFPEENFRIMRETGYTRLAVPVELGGLGASMRQVAFAQAALAKGCAATAIAVNMHHYLVLANVYRWRHGAPVDGMLRRVADEGLILMTSGGSDGIWPSGSAIRVEGGYRVNARKAFCSQAPTANVLATMTSYDDPEDGKIVLMISVPMTSPGVEILETWDTMGMRASGSHEVELNDVFISDAQVVMRRPWGKVDIALRNAGIHFAPPVAAVYHGIAVAARDQAVQIIEQRKNGDGVPQVQDPMIQRQIGLMDYKLKTSWWSLLGALDEIGEDYSLDEPTMAAVMMAKRDVLTAATEVVDLAVATVGGAAYFRKSALERAYRDVRAGEFHPLTPEKTLLFAGQVALGQSTEKSW